MEACALCAASSESAALPPDAGEVLVSGDEFGATGLRERNESLSVGAPEGMVVGERHARDELAA